MNELFELGYRKGNTSIIERRNATARMMNSTQQRKTLAFARHSEIVSGGRKAGTGSYLCQWFDFSAVF
ncbi:MAG: hypothetical protein PVH18_08605 [Chloroflexota bacterium]|jgi:hypothetical protein